MRNKPPAAVLDSPQQPTGGVVITPLQGSRLGPQGFLSRACPWATQTLRAKPSLKIQALFESMPAPGLGIIRSRGGAHGVFKEAAFYLGNTRTTDSQGAAQKHSGCQMSGPSGSRGCGPTVGAVNCLERERGFTLAGLSKESPKRCRV